MRCALSATVFAAAMLVAAPAMADARAELEKARASYVARNYPEAEARLRQLLDQPKSGLKEAGLVAQARMVLGAALIAEGKKEAGADLFEQLVLEEASFEPDPLSYPSDAINIFIDVRSNLRDRIRVAAENAAAQAAERRAREEASRRAQEDWLVKVKLQAQEERSTIKNSRLVATVPFGIGQLQNNQPVLGWLLFGVEAGLVASTVVTLPMYAYARNREQEELAAGDVQRKAQIYNDRADNIRTTNLFLVGSFGVVALAGILQANAAFVPERVEKKKRPLPPLPTLQPTLSVLPGGAYVGLTGTTF